MKIVFGNVGGLSGPPCQTAMTLQYGRLAASFQIVADRLKERAAGGFGNEQE